MRSTADVPAIATRQDGAFTRAQAYEVGWSAKSLATAVRREVLVRQHPNVFVVASMAAPGTQDWAALLAAGACAVLSGWSAARVLGLRWSERPWGPPCVWVPVDAHPRLDGVTVVRWALPTDQVRSASPPTTTTARTILDCLRLSPRVHRESMLDTALLRGWITVPALAAQVQALNGQHGSPAMLSLLRGVSGGARSRAEREAQQVLGRTGVPGWRWNCPVPLVDGTTAVVDAALPALKIAVEVDGRAFHTDAHAFQHDRTRQNALVGQGWIVLRFTWWDLTRRPDYVVDAVLQAVASRAA